jgi:hypothetical protein
MERNEFGCQMFAGMNRKFLDVEDSPRGMVMGMFGNWNVNLMFERLFCKGKLPFLYLRTYVGHAVFDG